MSAMFRTALFSASLIILAFVIALPAEEKDKKDDKPERDPDIHWVPTPMAAVEKMLEVAKVTKDDIVYDLGCGDGRIVTTAASKYKCKATGYDIDPVRIKDSEKRKAKLDKDIQKLVSFKKEDVFKVDLSGATVITLYLLPSLNVKLIPQLKKLKAGSRIVSHDFDMEGVTPDKGFPITVKGKRDNGDPVTSQVYKWTTPLKMEKKDD